jgi:CheY-like chemotaxis protein
VTNDPEPHLLVVDDDARLRELLRRYLTDNGFRITTAADASEARSQLAGFAFDLVVLDVMMPGESGLELTRMLRGEGRIPVLLLTAMAEPEDRINGLEQGADPGSWCCESAISCNAGRTPIRYPIICALAVAGLMSSVANCTVAVRLCI